MVHINRINYIKTLPISNYFWSVVCVILTRRLFSKTFSFERESKSLGDKAMKICLAISEVQSHELQTSQCLLKIYYDFFLGNCQ